MHEKEAGDPVLIAKAATAPPGTTIGEYARQEFHSCLSNISPPPPAASRKKPEAPQEPQAPPVEPTPSPSPHPLATPAGIPIEKDAVLFDDSGGSLDNIDKMARVVRANGYRCDSISGYRPFFFSNGFELNCNRFAYTYEFEDKGRGFRFKAPD